jgi:hypothetical protein
MMQAQYRFLLQTVNIDCYNYIVADRVVRRPLSSSSSVDIVDEVLGNVSDYKKQFETCESNLATDADKEVFRLMWPNAESKPNALTKKNGFLKFFNHSSLLSVERPSSLLNREEYMGLFKIHYAAAQKVNNYGGSKGAKIMRAIFGAHGSDPGLQLFAKACAAVQLGIPPKDYLKINFDLYGTCRRLEIEQSQIFNIHLIPTLTPTLGSPR